MNSNRIIGKKEDISYNSVESFFEKRGESNLKHKYNYVMNLDETPEIAIERDKHSKEKIVSLLNIQPDMSVLDLGCGIGRWGELFLGKGTYYVGIDGNENMIQRATENLSSYQNKKLLVGNLREVNNIISNINDLRNTRFDIIFICGVLMYLNDNDVVDILVKLPPLLNPKGHICFIESMSDTERLTLKDFYSDELKLTYSAIYRTVSEFDQIMRESFGDKLTLLHNELMDFSDGLQKKREHVTMEHCMIWESVE